MAETVRVKDLVRDMDIYPRAKLDTQNVSMLVDAIRSGIDLPPITADRTTSKVVDGFHRCAANERLFGEDEALVEVEWEDFEDETEMFRVSARVNSNHGKKLSSYDKDVCVTKAETFGIDIEDIAFDLSIPADKLRRRVTVSGSIERMPGVMDQKPIALKRDFRHLEGKPLNQAALEAHAKANGAGVLYSARDVIRRIESGTVNWKHESVIRTLIRLREVLAETPELEEPEFHDAA